MIYKQHLNNYLLYNLYFFVEPNCTLFDFYIVAITVLFLSALGFIFLHKNLIVVFMCFEIFIITISFTFLVHSIFFSSSVGFFFSYVLLVTAGSESALALAILTAYFFVEQHINIDYISKLKG